MGEKWAVDNTFNYVKNRTGQYPAVYGIDMLFDQDKRASAVSASIEYWKMGCLVAWSWHAVQPGKPESGTTGWNDMHSGSDQALVKKILTNGSAEQIEWFKRIDNVAGHIKTLQDSGVVLIWRPFHECNYDWFWWGELPETPQLYRQMWDRFVNHHKLRNIIWNWNVNYEFMATALPMASYYPGHEYVDITSIDIYIEYQHTWSKSQYDKLYQIGAGRPVAVGENGIIPNTQDMLSKGINWIHWMTWNGFENKTDAALYSTVYKQTGTIGQGEVNVPTWNPAWDSPTSLVAPRTSPRSAMTSSTSLGIGLGKLSSGGIQGYHLNGARAPNAKSLAQQPLIITTKGRYSRRGMDHTVNSALYGSYITLVGTREAPLVVVQGEQ